MVQYSTNKIYMHACPVLNQQLKQCKK